MRIQPPFLYWASGRSKSTDGKYMHTKEECVTDLMSEYNSGTPVHYALAGYNQIMQVLHPTTKEPTFLIGFECRVGGRNFSFWQGNERGGVSAGASWRLHPDQSANLVVRLPTDAGIESERFGTSAGTIQLQVALATQEPTTVRNNLPL